MTTMQCSWAELNSDLWSWHRHHPLLNWHTSCYTSQVWWESCAAFACFCHAAVLFCPVLSYTNSVCLCSLSSSFWTHVLVCLAVSFIPCECQWMFEQQDASCRLVGLQAAKINQESICQRLTTKSTPTTTAVTSTTSVVAPISTALLIGCFCYWYI